MYNWITLCCTAETNTTLSQLYFMKIKIWGDLPGSLEVKISPLNAGAEGSIPGQGAKIPHASWPKTKTKTKQNKTKHKAEAIW